MNQIKLPSINTLTLQEYEDGSDDITLLKEFDAKLKQDGFCYIYVKGGDYDGSIAKFVLDVKGYHPKLFNIAYRNIQYNVNVWWTGNLRFKGKPNKPKFTLCPKNCYWLPNYDGATKLVRIDLKGKAEKLLQQDVFDINDCKLSIGDKILYLNLRYGCGGKLCHGTVRSFKAHARQEFVSVIITNDEITEESECNYPHNQVYKKW